MKPNLNKALLGDIDYSKIDFEKHARFVIGRVLMRGNLQDWREIKRYYGIELIKKEVVKIRYLDKKTLNFCHIIFNIKKEKFRCYNTEPSIQKLWNY